MSILARTFVVCLMASCHGIANCAVVQTANKQEIGAGSSIVAQHAPITTAGSLSESIVPGSLHTVSTVTKIRQVPFQQLRVLQDTSLVNTTSSQSSSIRPTRTGEDTSRPPTSYIHSPIMTTIPEHDLAPLYLDWPGDVDPEDLIPLFQSLADDDNADVIPRDNYDDGYGFGYGSSTAGPVNGGYGNPSGTTTPPAGGYGNPPETTDLPSGGYGNPPLPPAVVDPSIVTLPDPPTVTISLEMWSSSFDPSTSTDGATVVVVVPAPSTEAPEPDVTVTVAPPQATLPLPLSTGGPTFTTIIVPGETPHSTPGYVYTTVTPSHTGPHAVTSTFVVVNTPTAHPSPVPIGTSTGRRVQPSLRFTWAITIVALATIAATGIINGPKRANDLKTTRPKHCEH
ncbi:uncharacterized protein GGS22DRAFT_194015 [Annulohypoxylon maeteangense]|uniref:uncharacterized protein n=1 Tax=Annulohypoxylon maeteangense TaxID=1927788 RepID=UPI002007AEE6|nr:uncharacterized protein GGS22DRAFT_194015 [Annulohypoxylon maeteangense]KAI0889575.1 hypothetical protein GGS22DRAFT_194015 [Annulohypoxylon maeteangense]